MALSRIFLSLLFSLVLLVACQDATTPTEKAAATPAIKTAVRSDGTTPTNVAIDDYWRQGKAELNRYTLSQNRYREVHPGEAVVVFVLEDFLTDKQVKNDRYQNPNSTPVLKTNAIYRFTTGLYDYSIMNSIFTPFKAAEFPQTQKVTNTVQDWCGQVFTQLNANEEGYRMQGFSYFEGEGDQDIMIKADLLEDELFNRIRLNPGEIPTGKVNILPSLQVIRLLHLPPGPLVATISVGDYPGADFIKEGDIQMLTIEYPAIRRKQEIYYTVGGTHEILGWKDSYPSVFDGQIRETTARRTNKLLTDYWSKNQRADESLRDELGLTLNPRQ